MGAKTWMLVLGHGDIAAQLAARPALDRKATEALAAQLFPGTALTPLPDGSLGWTSPPRHELLAGCLGDGVQRVTVLAHEAFALDRPSQLDPRFLNATGATTVVLHAMHSVVDWFAFAVWQDGRLVRSLSLSPDSGVIEDIGERLPFEQPFWQGQHPVDDPDDLAAGEPPYPLPFHPLELGEAALQHCLGYQLEGIVDAKGLDPDAVPLMRFALGGVAGAAPTAPTTPTPAPTTPQAAGTQTFRADGGWLNVGRQALRQMALALAVPLALWLFLQAPPQNLALLVGVSAGVMALLTALRMHWGRVLAITPAGLRIERRNGTLLDIPAAQLTALRCKADCVVFAWQPPGGPRRSLVIGQESFQRSTWHELLTAMKALETTVKPKRSP